MPDNDFFPVDDTTNPYETVTIIDPTPYILEYMLNIQALLKLYLSFLGIRDVYITKDKVIEDHFPYIVIDLKDFKEQKVDLQDFRKRHMFGIFNLFIHYGFKNEVLELPILTMINKLATIFREKWDVNRYCPTLGALVVSAHPSEFKNKEDKRISGGTVVVECVKELMIDLPF